MPTNAASWPATAAIPTATETARTADMLRADLAADRWLPTTEESDLAEEIARLGPSASVLRSALRRVPPGRLAQVLAMAAAHLEAVPMGEAGPDLLPLHQLLDAVAPPLP